MPRSSRVWEIGEGRDCWTGRTERSVLRLPSKLDIGAIIPSSVAGHFPHPRVSGGWRAHELWCQPLRYLSSARRLHRQDFARCQAGRSSRATAYSVRASDQYADRKDDGARRAAIHSRCGRRIGRMRWHDFRFWHETDMPTTLRDVRFQGKNGSRISGPSGPLMTLAV
jgi:hypothetical protein